MAFDFRHSCLSIEFILPPYESVTRTSKAAGYVHVKTKHQPDLGPFTPMPQYAHDLVAQAIEGIRFRINGERGTMKVCSWRRTCSWWIGCWVLSLP